MRLIYLAIALLSTGCTLLCANGSVDHHSWQGDPPEAIEVSGTGGLVMVAWDTGLLHTVVIDNGERRNAIDFSSQTQIGGRARIASSPNGHLLVSGFSTSPAIALSFDRNGVLIGTRIPLADQPLCAATTAFDGTSFVVAWCEYTGPAVATIAPGADVVSAPISIDAPAARELAIAHGGGVTWLVWRDQARIVGVRFTGTTRIDATPVLLLDGVPPLHEALQVVASGGHFLLAVEAVIDPSHLGTLLVPFDAAAVVGAPVGLDQTNLQLSADAQGFAALRRPPYVDSFPSTGSLAVTLLGFDGAVTGQLLFAGVSGALGFDGSRAVLAHRIDRTEVIGETASSRLSLVPLDGGQGVHLATASFERVTVTECEPDPAY